METLKVKCGKSSYPIHIGGGLFDELDKLLAPYPGARRIVISDDVVAGHYLKRVRKAAGAAAGDVIVFANGERSKTLQTCETIYTALLERGISRDTLLIVLGGGVVGDMAGFVAATYLRGVPFVQLPTTLLAQVDSAVGGKTAVNHPLGKNMIGAFYQPQCVIADLDTIKTLPERHFAAALAEVIKYGAILDMNFFFWVWQNMDLIQQRSEDALTRMIYRSCELKAEVVGKDERETSGYRAILNFGHTFGHALEKVLGYGAWLHGEAVGCGMVLAARLSHKCDKLSEEDMVTVADLVKKAELPHAVPKEATTKQLMDAMRLDKKNTAAKQRFVLLNALGSAVVSDTVKPADVKATLNESR